MIGDKSLSCGAVATTERHLDVCVTPRPCALLTTCTVRLLPHTGLYFRKTSAINPSNMCLNDISPVCVCECLRPRDEYMLRGWIEINGGGGKCDGSDLEVQNVFEGQTSKETNHYGRLDSPSHRVLMTFCALILWS